MSPELTDLAEAGDHSYGEPTAAELRPVFEGEPYPVRTDKCVSCSAAQRAHAATLAGAHGGPCRQLHGPPRQATLPSSTAR